MRIPPAVKSKDAQVYPRKLCEAIVAGLGNQILSDKGAGHLSNVESPAQMPQSSDLDQSDNWFYTLMRIYLVANLNTTDFQGMK